MGGMRYANVLSCRDNATPRAVFTARGFLAEMGQGDGIAEAALFTSNGAELAPTELHESPDPAFVWVVGMYALVFRRAADPSGLDTHVRFLRDGGEPVQLLETLMASPERLATGATDHPDLAEAYVTGAYLILFGRRPDRAGLRIHATAFRGGLTPAALLQRLWSSQEAHSSMRTPPAPVDQLEILARKIQTVGLRTRLTPETSADAKAALERGMTARQVIESLARREGRRSLRSTLVVLTSRPRAAAATAATTVAAMREETLRTRTWQLRLQHSTWHRLDYIHSLVTELRLASQPDENSAP